MLELATGLPVPFLTRSWLFLQPQEEAALHAGLRSAADILVIDMSVSAAARSAYRQNVCEFAASRGRNPGEPALFILLDARSNALTADLSALMPMRPDGIMISNASGAQDIQRLDVLLTVAEADNDINAGQTRLAVLADGLDELDLADKSSRLIAIAWSASRLMQRLGASRMHDASGMLVDSLRYSRARILCMAAKANIEAVDSESGLISTSRLNRDATEAASDGFSGKITLTPRQAPQINHAFSPSADSIREAQALLNQKPSGDQAQMLRAMRILGRAESLHPRT